MIRHVASVVDRLRKQYGGVGALALIFMLLLIGVQASVSLYAAAQVIAAPAPFRYDAALMAVQPVCEGSSRVVVTVAGQSDGMPNVAWLLGDVYQENGVYVCSAWTERRSSAGGLVQQFLFSQPFDGGACVAGLDAGRYVLRYGSFVVTQVGYRLGGVVNLPLEVATCQ